VIEAEPQVVLITPTDHDFQDAFWKRTQALGTVNTLGRGLLRGWKWAVGSKLVLTRWRH
jgi:hypothetical protein